MTLLSKKTKGNQNVAIGEVIFWEKNLNGIHGKTEAAYFRITVYDHSIIRIQVSREDYFSPNPYSVISQPKEVEFEVVENKEELTIET